MHFKYFTLPKQNKNMEKIHYFTKRIFVDDHMIGLLCVTTKVFIQSFKQTTSATEQYCGRIRIQIRLIYETSEQGIFSLILSYQVHLLFPLKVNLIQMSN